METKSGKSEMMTTTEVAKLLHVHPNTVRHWANRGLLRVHRLGSRGDRRFKPEDVDSFMRGNNNSMTV